MLARHSNVTCKLLHCVRKTLPLQAWCSFPLIAAIRGSEPRLPISLVSISAAERTVTCASHDSTLRHYRYTWPVSPDSASEELSEALTAQMQASQSARQQSSATESGMHIGDEERGCASSACDSVAVKALASHSKQQTGQRASCAQGLTDLAITEVEAWPSAQHRQRTDHDRQQDDGELTKAPGRHRAGADEPPGQVGKPVQRELPRCNGCTAGSHAEPGLTGQALQEISTEAVSALTVIESALRFTADDGSSEQLLSGFQVGPESSTAHLNLSKTSMQHAGTRLAVSTCCVPTKGSGLACACI